MGQLGDISPQGSIAIGIIVGLLSTSIQSLGLTLQRKSHLIEDAKDHSETRRPPYKRRRWQLGMLMFVVSNLVGSTIQITTLPLPVLSTLQASGLVFNTAFATLLLSEPFTHFSVVGTILTCSGAALIATFGAIGEPAHNLHQLLQLLAERDFIIWMVGTMIVVVVTILLAHVLKMWSSRKYISQSLPKTERPRSASMNLGPSLTLSRSFTAQLPQPLKLRISRLRLIRGLCYALISGILSAHSLLVAKSAVELLVRTVIDHKNQFNRFQSWLILIALLFFAVTQLYYLHLGLRLCSTSVLYPFVFCIYNIIAILDGLIYFQQASRLSALHAGLVALGTVILLSGVLALSWRLDDTTPSESAHPALPPRTPLTPGMGLMQSAADEREALLPTGRMRSSTSLSRRSIDEQTPLLVGRTRPPMLSIHAPPDTDTEGIWAELDDDEPRDDYLASLPRTPSPFWTHTFKTRRRGDSESSRAISTGSRRSSLDSKISSAKDKTESVRRESEDSNGPHQRRNSATQTPLPLHGANEIPQSPSHTRHRSTSIRFANNQDQNRGHEQRPSSRQTNPSRYDLSVGGGGRRRRWKLKWFSGHKDGE
ncbi:uncharacterized protein Z518_01144 [Rhinocladiella mackenziei CBS 650.93]|uniref:Rhinocladiella mackenziei CBS 650.93 unplaced genomic scaffold supercont1.1, whole genome shotgun sequence n=1 Tax=Rhinocladiella mackenziei CBS 650.93 TaxID=1442369 RepID=A0A0D2HHF2_9EURO|nr:uncharacterized protein Z518_01144 [Rhinocladiella mackenziei CBS 650.93]KIX10063.1 hypothetical protein Z518_01144 [Rhinocladiella mackenziei CBS 650.93]